MKRTGNATWIRLRAVIEHLDDPRLLVEKRSGLGLTFNFAHPVAWVLLGIIIAVIVVFVLIVPYLAR